MKVKDIMTTHIIYGNDNDSIHTDRDLTVRVIANQDMSGQIHSYLSTPIITIKEDDSLKQALSLMSRHQIKRLLVTREEKIVGIISISDLYFAMNDSNKIMETLHQIKKINKNKTVEDAQIDAFYL